MRDPDTDSLGESMSTVSPPVQASGSRAKSLARASWIIFLGIVVANSLLRRSGLAGFADVIGLVAAMTGLGLAAAALVYVRRDGWRGILVPALIGAVLNGLTLLIWITNSLSRRS